MRSPLTDTRTTLTFNNLRIECVVRSVRCMSTLGVAQSTPPAHLSAEEMPRICANVETIVIESTVAAISHPLSRSGGRMVDQWRTPQLASYLVAAAKHREGSHIWHWVRSESSSNKLAFPGRESVLFKRSGFPQESSAFINRSCSISVISANRDALCDTSWLSVHLSDISL